MKLSEKLHPNEHADKVAALETLNAELVEALEEVYELLVIEYRGSADLGPLSKIDVLIAKTRGESFEDKLRDLGMIDDGWRTK